MILTAQMSNISYNNNSFYVLNFSRVPIGGHIIILAFYGSLS